MPSPCPTIDIQPQPLTSQQEFQQRICLDDVVPTPAQVVDTTHAGLIGVIDSSEGWVVGGGSVDQKSDHLFIGSLASNEEAVLQLMRLVSLVHTPHQHRFEDLRLFTHLWVVLFSAQLKSVDNLGSLRRATI